MSKLLEIKGLHASVEGKEIIRGLDLEIGAGEVHAIMGPNGSGKTTAINCLLALLKYDKGTITVFGKEMHPDSYDIKQDIGVVMQNVAVFDQMSVWENIDY